MLNTKKILFLLFISVSILILYYPALFTYFSQDDFFHFKISQSDGSLGGFIKLFGFYPFEERGIAFYRPLFREALYFSYYNFFGLNHIPFRLLSFSILIINSALVYSFLQKLLKNVRISLFSAFFYAISASNVATLYYLAGGIQAIGATLFILICLVLFLNFLETKSRKKLILSFFTFLLALASHELAAVLPLLLLGLTFLYIPRKDVKNFLIFLVPFILVLAVYMSLEVFLIGFSSQEKQYQVALSFKTFINTFSWYSAWALGLPEMLIDFVSPGLKLKPALMQYWGNYFLIIFPTFFISLCMISSAGLYLFWKQRRLLINKQFLFLLFWFPLGIFPVIFLPLHKSTYYLNPVLPAFWGTIGFLIFNAHSLLRKKYSLIANILLIITLASFFYLSFASAKLGAETYWASTRGKLAHKLLDGIRNKYPTLPKGAIISLKNDPNHPFIAKEWGGSAKQASFILNGSDALQLLYNDATIKVFYEGQDAVFEKSSAQIYEFVVEIY